MNNTKTVLETMFDALLSGNAVYHPSEFWKVLNKKNIEQLDKDGLKNLKQTVSSNYFTWIIGFRHPQFRYLFKNLSFQDLSSCFLKFMSFKRSSKISFFQQMQLSFFTHMLWRFTIKQDSKDLLSYLEEPLEGNPFAFFFKNKLISQDLANSLIEYYAIHEHLPLKPDDKITICEIGAGYGRNAYVFLNAHPKSRYIIIDIPPALYISQSYLTSVFPNKKVFAFREFTDITTHLQELSEADLVFLLPHQAELLNEKSIDLFINISSLHEMTQGQIEAYFQMINRLTKGFFYTKQWKTSINSHDNLVIKKENYPTPAHWQVAFDRTAKVQTHFFESLYLVGE